MSRETHYQFLEKAALKEAQKAFDRQGRDGFLKEDFGGIRIQTVEPWKRLVLAVSGVLFCGAGVFLLGEDIAWLAVAFFVVGAFCMFAAVFGRKKTVSAALEGIDIFTLLEALS